MSLALRLGLLGVALSFVATGCATGDEGDPHPTDRLDFPVAVTADPSGAIVWVTSGNFDLAYRGGAILAIDVASNTFIDELAFEVGGFPGPLRLFEQDGRAVAGYVLSREEDALFHVSFDGNARVGTLSVDCVEGTRNRDGSGILRCPNGNAIRSRDVARDDEKARLEVGPDPFAAVVRASRASDEPDLLLTGAMVDGTLASFELEADGTPLLVGNTTLFSGLFALVESPTTGAVYSASKTNNIFQVVDVFVDPDEQPSLTDPFLRVTGGVTIPEARASDRARDLAISLDGTRLYASYRAPDSLVIVDISEDTAGNARNRVIAKIPLSENPGDIEVVRAPDGRELVYVACFSDDRVEVVDPAIGQVVASVRTGSGPFGLAYVESAQLGLARLYVTQFDDHSVGVIELDPSSPYYHTLVAEIR